MKLKLDADGHVVLLDGKPVYTDDDGKEIAFDVASTTKTIGRLQAEAKTHREDKEAAQTSLKEATTKLESFADLDPKAAKAAIDTLGKIDQSKLIDSGKVDEVRAAMAQTYEGQIADLKKTSDKTLGDLQTANETLTGQLHKEVIGGSFARSKVIADKLAIPADLVQAAFGNNFKMVDGKMQAVDTAGKVIYSRSRHGEIADFDEAMEALIDAYPNKDQILKSTGSSGTGSKPSAGTNAGSKSISRSQFEQLSPVAQSAHFKSGATVTDE